MMLAVAELVPHFVITSVSKNLSLHKGYIRIKQQYIRFGCKLNYKDIILSSVKLYVLLVNVKVYSPIEAFDTLFT
jgi:hypothetical protein